MHSSTQVNWDWSKVTVLETIFKCTEISFDFIYIYMVVLYTNHFTFLIGTQNVIKFKENI